MYCCETDDQKATKKGKGIDRKIVRNKLTIDDFLYTLTDNKKSHYTSNKICSKNHQVFSITINKVGLSNYDNKRYYTDKNINSIWALFTQLIIFRVLNTFFRFSNL